MGALFISVQNDCSTFKKKSDFFFISNFYKITNLHDKQRSVVPKLCVGDQFQLPPPQVLVLYMPNIRNYHVVLQRRTKKKLSIE